MRLECTHCCSAPAALPIIDYWEGCECRALKADVGGIVLWGAVVMWRAVDCVRDDVRKGRRRCTTNHAIRW